MPKYTKSVRKNNMRKSKRGRSRRGGYFFYPSPGDDEHAFTKLRSNLSSGNWKFWQKKPEEVPVMPVSSDYQPAAEEPMPEQAQGSLEYPQVPMEENPPIDDNEAPMEPSPPMDEEQAPMDSDEDAVEPNPETADPPQAITGGRRRRRSRATKKRKRVNMRRRTNKRRRSNKRRR